MHLFWLLCQILTVGIASDKTCEPTADRTCTDTSILYHHGVLPVVDRVPREEWDYTNPNFRDELILRTTPVILTNSPVTKWKAVANWNPKSIVKKVGKNTIIYVSESRDGNFLYHSASKAERFLFLMCMCMAYALSCPVNRVTACMYGLDNIVSRDVAVIDTTCMLTDIVTRRTIHIPKGKRRIRNPKWPTLYEIWRVCACHHSRL